jgi:hypothetical protein
VEQVAHLDRRAHLARHEPALDHPTAFHPHERRGLIARAPRHQLQAAHRGDAGQRLAAKSERRQAVEVVERRHLRGGVPLERQLQFARGDAAAVIRDAELLVERARDPDLDRACTGIERVLDDLLQRRQRSLDDLARGDA